MTNPILEAQPSSTEPDNGRTNLQSVIDLVLRQEQERQERAVRRAEKRRRQERDQRRTNDERLREAVHTIKWCVVGICSVMVLALVLGVWALVQVEHAVAEVERDVEQITARVDNILHEVEHPFEGAGRMLGRDLDRSVGEFFGINPTASQGDE